MFKFSDQSETSCVWILTKSLTFSDKLNIENIILYLYVVVCAVLYITLLYIFFEY